MFGCQCLLWSRISDPYQPQPETFSLPAPIPEWPSGESSPEPLVFHMVFGNVSNSRALLCLFEIQIILIVQ